MSEWKKEIKNNRTIFVEPLTVSRLRQALKLKEYEQNISLPSSSLSSSSYISLNQQRLKTRVAKLYKLDSVVLSVV